MGYIEDQFAHMVAEQMGVDPSAITPETRFVEDLGADSLDVIEMIMETEELFDVALRDAEAEQQLTVAAATAFIRQALADSGQEVGDEDEDTGAGTEPEAEEEEEEEPLEDEE